MLKRLLRHRVLQAALAWAVGRYLGWALASTRWTLHGAEHVAPQYTDSPVIAGFWHERLPLMPALWRWSQRHGTTVPMVVLVSRHNDGRFIGDVIRHFDLEVVHGSSARKGRERGGAAGLRNLLDRLAAGCFVGITPDGPRGPRRQAALGIAQLAALSGVPVLPCAAQTTRRIVLNTWDRMVVPLPYGRGVLVCQPQIAVPRDGAEAALPAIEAGLTAAADSADRLCR